MIEAMTEYMNTPFDIFMSKTVVELHLFRKFLSCRVRSNARKAEMAEALAGMIVEEPTYSLKRFPLYELRFLQMVASLGEGKGMEFNKTSMHLHSCSMGLVELADLDENLFALSFAPGVHPILAPHIDAAVREIESSPRFEYEHFFWGCLALYGTLTYQELFDIARDAYPDTRERTGFMRFLTGYPAVEWTEWRNYLVHPCADWNDIIEDRRQHSLEEAAPKSFSKEDILDAGTTMPYCSTWHLHPEGQGAIGALRSIGYDDDRLVYSLHRLWIAKEVYGRNAKAFNSILTGILEGGRISGGIDTVNEVAGRLVAYANALPCWGFKGRSSDDLFKKDRSGPEKLAGAKTVIHQVASISRQASAFGKVGRNDPCPCGSGLKYKNCHGKNIS